MTGNGSDARTAEDHKRLVTRLYGSLMARGDVDAGREVLADDYVDHDIPGVGAGGREDLVTAVLQVRAAFPDIAPQLHEMVGDGEWVAVRVVAAGTHTGEPFAGIAATGGAISWKEQHLFRCADGRIVEHRGVFDMLSILQQLGAVPS